MNVATNRVAGRSKMSAGEPVCSIPTVHDHDAIRHRQRLVLIVRDVEKGRAGLALHPAQLPLHQAAQREIERTERLIEQQHGGVQDEGASERDALLLTAGELLDSGVLRPGQRDEVQDGGDAGGGLPFWHAALDQTEGDVVGHREMRKERVILKHHRGVASMWREIVDRSVTNRDRSRIGALESADQAKRRALSTSGRAEKGHELTGWDLQGHVIDGQRRIESLADGCQTDVTDGQWEGRSLSGRDSM